MILYADGIILISLSPNSKKDLPNKVVKWTAKTIRIHADIRLHKTKAQERNYQH